MFIQNHVKDQSTTVQSSVDQGFEKPWGFLPQGTDGRGTGMDIVTPQKPIPLTGVWGVFGGSHLN